MFVFIIISVNFQLKQLIANFLPLTISYSCCSIPIYLLWLYAERCSVVSTVCHRLYAELCSIVSTVCTCCTLSGVRSLAQRAPGCTLSGVRSLAQGATGCIMSGVRSLAVCPGCTTCVVDNTASRNVSGRHAYNELCSGTLSRGQYSQQSAKQRL